MPLISNSYGKGRVRVMRVDRSSDRHEIRELSVQTMLEGGFGAAYTSGDNSAVVATDTIKNIAYIVARENMGACAEEYAGKLAARFLDRYPQVERATVRTQETRWTRAVLGGAEHPHTFTLDANGKPMVALSAGRDGGVEVVSGIAGYTFMKSTQSGWVDYVMDEYTTLPETRDRIAATAMDATWTWLSVPADYPAANALILSTMLEVFGTTYSHGVQDSLYRMGEAALAAVPELGTISMACPNKHYIPMALDRFGLSADNMVFIATDEPHGQIECTVGRAA
ncbi:MAG TPA: urate oxidase [Acetobacteraceae bacterium]